MNGAHILGRTFAAACGPRCARVLALAVAALTAGTVLAADPAHAETPAAPSHSYPLRPAPVPQGDPMSEVQDLLRQISNLDDTWDSLTPEQRQQRIAGLQLQATTVDRDTRNLPPDQQPAVEGTLGLAIVRLLDLARKAQRPNQPCYFPACLPGL